MVSGPNGSCRILPPHDRLQNHDRRSRCSSSISSAPFLQKTRQQSFGEVRVNTIPGILYERRVRFPLQNGVQKANLYKQSPLFPVELFHEPGEYGNYQPWRRIDTGKEFRALLPIRKKFVDFWYVILPKTGILILSDTWLPSISSGTGAQENGISMTDPGVLQQIGRTGPKIPGVPNNG